MSIYEIHKFNNPQFPFILHLSTKIQDIPANPYLNWHENIEILFFYNGEGTIAYDDQRIPVCKGDIAVINSNHLHGIGSNKSVEYHCLIIDRQFCLGNYFDTNEIQFEKVFQDPSLFEKMNELVTEYKMLPPSPYHTATVRAQVLSLLTSLCRNHSAPVSSQESGTNSIDYIRKAIGYIRTNYCEDISLESVANFVGISKYYFAREFRRITGYTFVTHLNLTRCEAAKELLAKDQMTIGAIGMNCGFSGQSYFTRTFQSLVGMLPGTYREIQRQKRQEQRSSTAR